MCVVTALYTVTERRANEDRPFADWFTDYRSKILVEHSLEELIA